MDHRCFTLIHFHELLDSLVYSHSSERGKKQIIRLERLIQSQFLLARFKGGAFWRAFLDQDNRCNLLKKIFLSSLRSLPFGVSYFFFFPNSWRFVRHHLVIESENRLCGKLQWKNITLYRLNKSLNQTDGFLTWLAPISNRLILLQSESNDGRFSGSVSQQSIIIAYLNVK